MEYVIVNGELRHWGIKGMKWGVRRYQNADGTLTSAGRKRYDDDGDVVTRSSPSKRNDDDLDDDHEPAPKKKTVKDMTDDELNSRLSRLEKEKRLLQVEKELSTLMNDVPPKRVNKGREIVEDILKDSAKNIGKQAATLVIGYATNKALQKVFKDSSMTVNPKKGQKDK